MPVVLTLSGRDERGSRVTALGGPLLLALPGEERGYRSEGETQGDVLQQRRPTHTESNPLYVHT